MALSTLGLDSDAEAVYRLMVAVPRAGVSELGERLEWSRSRVRDALDSLASLSLVRKSWENPDELMLVRPEIGLFSLLQLREAEFHEQQKSISVARHEISKIINEHERVSSRKGVDNFDYVEGIDSIRMRIEQLARECTESVWVFSSGGRQSRENLTASRPLDLDVLERGVELRDVYLDSVKNDPPTVEHISILVEAGAQARTAPVLPLRMLIYDGATAVVPADTEVSGSGAIVVHGTGFVAALRELFELVWRDAKPFGQEEQRESSDLPTSRERAILRLLSEGRTDAAIARDLGLSVRTARRDISAMMQRLGVNSRFQAGFKVAELGWLDDGRYCTDADESR
ncbi:LuxR C-terminal-related transcriptional regulator [Nocardiopsis alba]|jgi:DNA-binding CsgD family transcriptional regulator/sugar-specific transcriptional regulator TrmB|uniref:helix-turn-helix transcriptional regulator n=1 Tax=Nocardiopsis alba TaxID=53437 RepID=UPI0033BE7BEF